MIGMFAGTFCFLAMKILEQTSLDDPTGSFAIHGVGGIWGLIAVGIFAREDPRIEVARYDGMLRGKKELKVQKKYGNKRESNIYWQHRVSPYS